MKNLKYFDLFSGYGGRNKYTKVPSPDKDTLEKLYNEKWMTYGEIAEHFGVTIKIVQRWFKENGIKARKAYKRFQTRELNDNWKGGNACYAAFHRRLDVRFGKIKKCSVCGTNKSKHYDWANLTGKYEDENDYKRMCRSCHWKYDKKINNIIK